jgi:BirA family biotin operon repressor/biotin-[acetyl-CoA-carboxylase] ligase
MIRVPAPSPPAWHVHGLDEAPSTQDLAIAAAKAGAPPRTAYLAARQTAGRGRDGRLWQAPEGNLNLSVLLRPGASRLIPAQWSLMAGVALHDAITLSAAPHPDLILKWPNDLLLAGAKLAGILIDSSLTPAGTPDWIVIGIGANLRHAPALPDRPTTSLAGHHLHTTAAELAPNLLQSLDHWSAQPLATIIQAWLARAHPPGTPLRVRQGPHMIEGVFETLSPDGSLILRGHPPIQSGETTLQDPTAEGPDAARH